MKLRPLALAVLAFSFILSFTPIYSLGYIFLIISAAIYLPSLKIFSTIFSKIILYFLLTNSLIMLIGIATWVVHIQLYPQIVSAVLIIAYLITDRYSKVNSTNRKFFDLSDTVSLICAILIIPFIVISFYIPKPSSSASFQILTNGYDNSAHLSLITTSADENGYVYGHFQDVKTKTLTDLNAYPQGWHLATSHFFDGIGKKVFATSADPLLKLNLYLVALGLWYILAVYVASKVAWSLLKSLSSKRGTNPEGIDTYILFILSALVIQVMLYWGSLLLGFASFLSCLAYIPIAIASVINISRSRNDDTKKRFYSFAVGILAATAISQSWVLPFPSIILLLACGFFTKDLISLSTIRLFKKLYIGMITLSLIAVGAGIFQILIILKFSPVGITAALNNDGGVFWISNVLFGIITLFTYFIWMKQSNKEYQRKFLFVTGSFLLVLGGIFFFQLLTEQKTTYYFVKFLGLVLGVIGIYFVPAFVNFWKTATKSLQIPLVASISGMVIITTLFIATGQNTLSLSGFLQRNSKVTSQVADGVVEFLNSSDTAHSQVIVLKSNASVEDSDATYAANRLSHRYGLCNNSIFTLQNQTLSDQVERIKNCASSTTDTITVLADSKTFPLIQALNAPNIEIRSISN